MSNAGAEHEPLYRHIVVGVDGSAASAAALRHAGELAEQFNADLTVVTAWHFPATFTGNLAGYDPERDALTILDDAVRTNLDDAVQQRTRRVTPSGAAALALIDASRDADLLVVGSRGRGGFSGLLLGSVSAHCAAHALCPVLVHH